MIDLEKSTLVVADNFNSDAKLLTVVSAKDTELQDSLENYRSSYVKLAYYVFKDYLRIINKLTLPFVGTLIPYFLYVLSVDESTAKILLLFPVYFIINILLSVAFEALRLWSSLKNTGNFAKEELHSVLYANKNYIDTLNSSKDN